MSSYR